VVVSISHLNAYLLLIVPLNVENQSIVTDASSENVFLHCALNWLMVYSQSGVKFYLFLSIRAVAARCLSYD